MSLVEIRSRSGLGSDCGSFRKLPVPSGGPVFGKTRVSLGCVRPPQGGPIGCSLPRAPLEGSFRVWSSGCLAARPRGVSHATSLGGSYVSDRNPSQAHAGGRVTPDRVFPPHIRDLRARVSQERGRCLTTPPSATGESRSCHFLSVCPWGPAPRRHTALNPRAHRAE